MYFYDAQEFRLDLGNSMALSAIAWFLAAASLFPAITVHCLLHSGLGSEDEVRLVETLFQKQGYNPLIRPVRNLNETITVKFGLAMIQLINVDEKNQIMKSNVWLRMLWNDYQLQWDPSEFAGINVIRIMPEKVWKPDIVLFNNADGKYEVSYKPNVVIFSHGDVLWIPPAIYKSSCTIDVKYFPFDQQECQMKFGSWTFNGDQVVLDWYEGQERVDLSDYVNSGTWNIMSCPGIYNYSLDPVEKHHKAQITFTLQIRRKTLFYTVNLIIPCVLISFLSVSVFYLPADAGEKMTMCISILLALIVFLLLVSKILPPTSITIPLIAKYLLFTFIMNIITILITVIIINWNFKTPRTHRMPGWVRSVFLNYLPRALLMTRPHHAERWSKKAYSRRNRPALNPYPGGLPSATSLSTIASVGAGALHGGGTGGGSVERRIQEVRLRSCTIPTSSSYYDHQRDEAGAERESFPMPPIGGGGSSSWTTSSPKFSPFVHYQPTHAPTLMTSSASAERLDAASNPVAAGLFSPHHQMHQQPQRQIGLAPRRSPNCHSLTSGLSADEPAASVCSATSGQMAYYDSSIPRRRATMISTETVPGSGRLGRGNGDHRLTVQQRSVDKAMAENDVGDVGGRQQQQQLQVAETKVSSSLIMTPETQKAIEAVRFIAAHLKNEDDYAEILDDWRYIAMVIDRLQLYIFLAVTICGTVGILIHAPHIFEFVDQDEIKQRIMGSGGELGV